jgi:membrane protease YdiL (CAAX protease family)
MEWTTMHLLWVIIPEEFFFRLFFFQTLDYEYSGTVPAARWLVLNALYFCLFHILAGASVENILTVFPGLLLAWTYYKTRDFPLVCCLHLVLNVIHIRILSAFPLFFGP